MFVGAASRVCPSGPAALGPRSRTYSPSSCCETSTLGQASRPSRHPLTKSPLPAARARSITPCPDDDTLAAFVQGQLECLNEDLTHLTAVSHVPEHDPRPSPGWRRRPRGSASFVVSCRPRADRKRRFPATCGGG